MKTKQKGFAVIELLLILLLVAIVGGTCYYVWHSQQQTDKTLNSAANTNQAVHSSKKASASTTKQPTQTEQSTQTEQLSQTGQASQGFLVIKDWGVQLKTSTLSGDAVYALKDDHTVYLSTTAYEKLSNGCGLNGSTGELVRGMAGYEVLGSGSYKIEDSGYSYVDSSGKTVQVNPVKAGDYYYTWVGPQAPCFNPGSKNVAQFQAYQDALSQLAYTVSTTQ